MQLQMTLKPSGLGCLCFVLVTVVCLAACSKGVTWSDVIGAYEANHAAGSEFLEIRPDNTYVYKFKPVGNGELSSTDKWELAVLGGEKKVALHNFYSHFPPASPGGQIELLGIEKSWGRVRLYLSYDLDQYYSRTQSGK